MIEGIVLVDKPVGWTSFDVVNFIRKLIANYQGVKPKTIKIGHAGTLDPFASGLLIILIGKNYTRKMTSLLKLDKVYQVGLVLGQNSTTGDIEGELTEISNDKPSLDEIKTVIKSFIGTINQKPPIYSAIKINGIRAYDYARKGREVDIPIRQVRINYIENIVYDYPKVEFICEVSSGTYIRSLVEDIGNKIKTGAFTSSLSRISVGNFNLSSAIKISSKSEVALILDNIIKIDLNN